MQAVNPRLLALATAVPNYRLDQIDVSARARGLFAEAAGFKLDRMMPVFVNAGIDSRYSTVPIDWYTEPHGWTDRNALYIEQAVLLLERAARDCLAQAGLRASDIDSVVTVSTTGIATPSLDAILVGRLGLRPDVRRLPIFGLGCAGGILGLARAADLARADPERRILFLVVELCTLCFRRNDLSKSNVVATALFGDGAAAAVISCDGESGTPVLGPAGEYLFPDSLDIMGWEVEEDGMKALFSRDIPALVRSQMRSVTEAFLAANDVALDDIRHFICHPGGTKVVAALEDAFGLDFGALDNGRGVLRDFGNMSAPTVLFVLKRALEARISGQVLMTAMGPGFSAGFMLLDIA
jgi:alkylresorcinol/alkylpyrone synthase